MEIFGVLFDEEDVQTLLDLAVVEQSGAVPQPRSDVFDAVIDNEHGLVELCGQLEYSSELLYAIDPNRYQDTAIVLINAPAESEEDETA